jgi:ankyrin repeat protein
MSRTPRAHLDGRQVHVDACDDVRGDMFLVHFAHVWEAAQQGDLARIHEWLPKIYGHARFEDMICKAYEVATCNDHVHIVQALLECSPTVSCGFTAPPLWWAASCNSVASAAALVTAKARPDCCHPYVGTSTLRVACDRGHDGALRYLMDAATPSELLAALPLTKAARVGRADVCRSLCLANADVNGRGEYGAYTALLVAVRKRDCATAAVLLDCRADVNLGFPLSQAIENRDTAMAQLLLQHKASVNYEQGRHSPLSHAVDRVDAAMARLLLQHKADLNCPALGRDALLCRAVAGRQVALVRVLLGARASPDTADSQGLPVLCLAARMNHAASVRLLLRCKASVDAR